MKKCRYCGIDKNEEEFYATSGNCCKTCAKEHAVKWAQENPEKRARIYKRYYDDNKVVLLEKQKASYKSLSPEKKEERRATQNRWQAENLEKVRESQKKWQEKNYSANGIYRLAHLIRSRLRLAYRTFIENGKHRISEQNSFIDYKAVFDKMGLCPGKYGRGAYTIDHIIPLRLLPLTTPIGWKMATDPRNTRWMLWGDNYKRGQTWDQDAIKLYKKLLEEYCGK